ncbi:hypothetical protein ACVWWX_002319, partial [Thermostichus sp. MS-CIW-28]
DPDFNTHSHANTDAHTDPDFNTHSHANTDAHAGRL